MERPHYPTYRLATYQVLGAIKKAGYAKPTGVQMMCIPLGLACKDVIGVAKTGSGKTCAFVLPMLVYILKQPPITKETAAEGPLALIMAPTRELVQQIEDETRKFAGELKIRTYSPLPQPQPQPQFQPQPQPLP